MFNTYTLQVEEGELNEAEHCLKPDEKYCKHKTQIKTTVLFSFFNFSKIMESIDVHMYHFIIFKFSTFI